jgi:hypothetical protein
MRARSLHGGLLAAAAAATLLCTGALAEAPAPPATYASASMQSWLSQVLDVCLAAAMRRESAEAADFGPLVVHREGNEGRPSDLVSSAPGYPEATFFFYDGDHSDDRPKACQLVISIGREANERLLGLLRDELRARGATSVPPPSLLTGQVIRVPPADAAPETKDAAVNVNSVLAGHVLVLNVGW